LYSINATVDSSKTLQAVANFGDDFFKTSDLNLFWSNFGLKKTSIEVMNDNDESHAALESSLDLE